MSEQGLHVHGAHDHAVEHQAHVGDGLSQQIAVFTAVLAAFGAIVGYLGGHTQNEALLYKNEAVLLKARASDQWAFYQAKSTKEHLVRMAADSAANGGQRDTYLKDAARYEAEKADIRRKAEEFDAESARADEESSHAQFPHTRLAQAMSAIQIAIALAAVTALTRKRWLLVPALFSAAMAILLTGLAYA